MNLMMYNGKADCFVYDVKFSASLLFSSQAYSLFEWDDYPYDGVHYFVWNNLLMCLTSTEGLDTEGVRKLVFVRYLDQYSRSFRKKIQFDVTSSLKDIHDSLHVRQVQCTNDKLLLFYCIRDEVDDDDSNNDDHDDSAAGFILIDLKLEVMIGVVQLPNRLCNIQPYLLDSAETFIVCVSPKFVAIVNKDTFTVSAVRQSLVISNTALTSSVNHHFVCYDSRILCFANAGKEEKNLFAVFQLDTKSMTWLRMGNFKMEGDILAAFVLNGKISLLSCQGLVFEYEAAKKEYNAEDNIFFMHNMNGITPFIEVPEDIIGIGLTFYFSESLLFNNYGDLLYYY